MADLLPNKIEKPNGNEPFALIVMFLLMTMGFSLYLWMNSATVVRSALDVPQMIAFQGKLTDANRVTVPNGSLNAKFSIYDAASGGNCLWTASGSCGTPTAISVTVTDGVFNVMLGESPQNALPDTLFNNNTLYLGVTIGADAEMSPRIRIGAVGFALEAGDADLLDGFDSTQVGAVSSVLVSESDGDLALSGAANIVNVSTNRTDLDALVDIDSESTDASDQMIQITTDIDANETIHFFITADGRVTSRGLEDTERFRLTDTSNTDTVGMYVGDGTTGLNGTLSAQAGSVFFDEDGKLWLNTTGSTTWEQVVTATGGITGADFLRSTASDTFEGSSDRTLTIESVVSGATRNVPVLLVTQANQASGDMDSSLVSINQADESATGSGLEVLQSGFGDAISITSDGSAGIDLDMTAINSKGIDVDSTVDSGNLIEAHEVATFTTTTTEGSYNFLSGRVLTMNGVGQTLTVGGEVMRVFFTGTETAGDIVHPAAIAYFGQLFTQATGPVLELDQDGTGPVIDGLGADNGQFYRLTTTGDAVGVYSGSATPSFSAEGGSLFLKDDNAGTQSPAIYLNTSATDTGTTWTQLSTAAGSTLQAAYDSGNTITATDARNLALTFADTATDPNFTVNLAGDGDFFVQDNGTTFFTLQDNGTVLTTAGAARQFTIDAAGTDSTITGAADGVLKLLVDANQAAGATNQGFYLNYESIDDANADQTFIGFALDFTNSSEDAGDTTHALNIANVDNPSGTAVATDTLLRINNADTTASSVTNAINVLSTGVDGGIVNGLNVSAGNISNAIVLGSNFAVFDGVRMAELSTGTLTIEDGSGNDMATFVDNGNVGDFTYTGRLLAPTHANNQGLRVPTNTGSPGVVTGTQEGDLVWDSTGNALYAYDGSAFINITGTGTTDTLDTVYDNDSDHAMTVDHTSGINFDLTTTGDFNVLDSTVPFFTLNDDKTLIYNLGSALTTENGWDLTNASTTRTSGDLIQADHTASYGTTQTVSGQLLDLTQALTVTANTLTQSGTLATIARSTTRTAGTASITGDVLALTNTVSGTATDSGDLLFLDQQNAANTGAALNINTTMTTSAGEAINLDAATTTGTIVDFNFNALTTGAGLDISANALTSGEAINVTTSAATGFGGSLVNISQVVTGSPSISGSLLTISRDTSGTIGGGNAGDLVTITNSDGATNDSSNLLVITQNDTAGTTMDAVVEITNAGQGSTLVIDHNGTALDASQRSVVDIDSVVTEGSALLIDQNATIAGVNLQDTAGASLVVGNTGNNNRGFGVYSANATPGQDLVRFEADNATFDEEVLYIVQAGTSSSIFVDQNGTVTGAVHDGAGGAIGLANTGNTSYGLTVYTNTDGTQTDPLAYFFADNVAFDQPVLSLESDGVGASLFVNADGATGATVSDTVGGAIHLSNTGNTDYGMTLYTNIGATQNQPLAYFFSDNVGSDTPVLSLETDGVGSSLFVNQDGNTGSTVSDTAGGAVHITNTGNANYGLSVYTNHATSTDPLGYFWSDNIGFDDDVVVIQSDATDAGTASGSALRLVQMEVDAPTSGTTGTQALIIDVNEVAGNDDVVIIRSDADGTPDTELIIEADGEVISDVGFTAGGASTNYYDGTITSTAGTFTIDSAGTIALGSGDDFSMTGDATFNLDSAEALLVTNAGTANITFNLTSTGDFVVSDAGASILSAHDAGFVRIGSGTGTNTTEGLIIDPGDVTGVTVEQRGLFAAPQSITLADTTTLTNQRMWQFDGPTLFGVAGGGTETVTNAATVYIGSAPAVGSDITISNPYSLWIDNGAARFDGRLLAAGHDNNQGLMLPTNAGAPSAVSGTLEGDIVWDSNNNNLYVYDGATFQGIGGATFSGTTLQGAYNSGNTISATDNRDIAFTLANTATDPNFIVNLAGDGNFVVQDNGTPMFTFLNTGNVTAAGDMDINGGNLNFGAATIVGDGADAITLNSSGTLTVDDTSLAFSGAGTITTGANGALTLTPDGTGDVVLNQAANTNAQILATGAKAANVDMLQISNAGFGFATANDLLDLTMEVATGAGVINNVINLTVPAPADASDITRGIQVTGTTNPTASSNEFGINIANLTGGAGTEIAMRIGPGWDNDLVLSDTTPNISIGNTGTLTFTDDLGNTLMTLADGGSIGNVVVSGDLAVNGDDITSDGTLTIDSSGLTQLGADDDFTTTGDVTHTLSGTEVFTVTNGGTANSVVDLTSTGDFIFADAGTAFLTLNDNKSIDYTTDQTTTNAIDILADSLSSGSLLTMSADALTSGQLFNIDSSSGVRSSGDFLNFNHTATYATTQTVSGSLVDLTQSLTNATASTTTTVSGDILSVIRSNTSNNASAVINVTSNLLSLVSNGTQTAGTLTDSSELVFIDNNYASATGALIAAEHAGTGALLDLSATGTGSTANGILIANTSTGSISDAIDVSDAEITNAINVGANDIQGTSATISFTNFIVASNGSLLLTNSDGNVPLSISPGGVTAVALDFNTTNITTEIEMQNNETISNNVNGAILLENDAGTDLINVSSTSLTMNIDDTTATYNERVCHSGANNATGVVAFADCAGSPGDLAEYYGSNGTLAAGDLVAVTGEAAALTTPEGVQTSKAYVEASSSAYQSGVIGVVSTHPNEVYAADVFDASENPVAVAQVGRVPVKVTDENGSIVPGDRIVASSTPGSGAKAVLPGWTVGVALQSHTSGSGTIIVMIDPSWYAGSVFGQDGSMTVVGDDIAMGATGTADATTAGYDSFGLSLRGSGWDGMAAQDVAMSINNTVVDASDYRLSIKNGSGAEVAYVTDDGAMNISGDLVIGGKLYPSDQGVAQSAFYIYFDSSLGAGMEYMRTNAAGWSTGSYDFAEMFPSSEVLEAGDVVVFDTQSEHVRRSAQPYDGGVAGIVSTRPGFLAGDAKDGDYPIALAGRVPTKVSLENGTIAVGDALTTSSRAGYAMKATKAGPIVGYALEPYDGSGDDRVIVFVNVSYWGGTMDAASTGTMTTVSSGTSSNQNLTTLNMDGDIYMHGNRIVDVGRINGISDRWAIDESGLFTTKGAFELAIESYQGETVKVQAVAATEHKITLSGSAVLADGVATIDFETISPSFDDITSTIAPVRVFVTLRESANGLFVVEADQNGFTVQETMGGTSDAAFDWLVEAYRKDYEPDAYLHPEEPVEETPVLEDPVAVEPSVVEEPVVEAPITDVPVEEPIAEEVPVMEEPTVVEEPVIAETSIDVPVQEQVTEETIVSDPTTP